MSRLTRATAVYAFCHLVVDLACVTTVMGAVAPALGMVERLVAVATYDMVAFCMQLPCGALMDVLGRRRSPAMAIFSFVLTAAGVLATTALAAAWLPRVMVQWVAVLLVALGNALFHCVGGVEVLGESEGKAGPSGAFISTGAIGVFVGGLTSFNAWQYAPWLLVGLLVACAGLVLLLGRLSTQTGGLWFQLSTTEWVAVALLAATVALRSYVGSVMAYPWKADPFLAAAAVGAVVAGKAVGGYVADGLGRAWASFLSLGAAAIAFLWSWQSVPAGLAATFFFNFTMAITLSALALLLPGAKGLAFGIASFSLAMGVLPVLLGVRVTSPQVLCVLSVVSMALLELGLLCAWRGRRT